MCVEAYPRPERRAHAGDEARRRGDKEFRSAARDVARLLEELKKDKVDRVLIDLRNNGGGLLDAAIAVSDTFLERGEIVSQRGRKPEDIEHWLDGLARVDALIVQDTDLSADPAVVLNDLAAPVAVVDGLRATPHRWASVLCERLESAPA